MSMPADIGVIDLMMETKASAVGGEQYDFLRPALREESSKSAFPVDYMFKESPYAGAAPGEVPSGADLLLPAMDRYGIERAMIPVSGGDEAAKQALKNHPDRFFASYHVTPNNPMKTVRRLQQYYETWGIKAATAFPCGETPQAPINSKLYYPIYAKCIELDIPICICTGVPGPRVPFEPQYVGHLDEVCYDFPELKVVMRHGGEPWVDLAVKLMVKWPNLYYSTSAFAPKYYPKAVIDFANTRGADKVMYAGYFPIGLTLTRIFEEMPAVPLRDEVWPKFLRENARRVFNLS
jgi:uncharacterized protein